MNAPRFPLMRLPVACSRNVLRILTAVQLFGVSLASKKSKSLVQSLKMKASEFVVYVGDSMTFSIRLSFLRRTSFVFLHKVEIYYRPYSNEIDRRTFINHTKLIFNTEKIKVEFGHDSQNFDFESILKGRLDIESIDLITDYQEENQRILRIMKPSIAYIGYVSTPRDVMVQNFDYLCAKHTTIRLDDLLNLNIRKFETSCSTVPAKVLNRFLKLWMRGSNLQLESLQLKFHIDYKIEEIFTRLQKTPNNIVKFFKSARRIRWVSGGTDIFRFDGLMATILVTERERNISEFEMFVWHDHCIAEERNP